MGEHEGERGGEEEKSASKYQKNNQTNERENRNMVSLSVLFLLMFGQCFCLQNTGHLVYGPGLHGRQTAKVADSATVCIIESCNRSHSKGNHAMLTSELNEDNVIIMIMSLFC